MKKTTGIVLKCSLQSFAKASGFMVHNTVKGDTNSKQFDERKSDDNWVEFSETSFKAISLL